LGLFVSGLASLPRIVTVHDVNLSPLSSKDSKNAISMTAVIKTYNEGIVDDASGSKKRRTP
jgi:type IV pilus assembly protein PilO